MNCMYNAQLSYIQKRKIGFTPTFLTYIYSTQIYIYINFKFLCTWTKLLTNISK